MCGGSKLNLRPLIESDTFAPAIKSALCSSAKCCCDKAIITMTWSKLLQPILPFHFKAEQREMTGTLAHSSLVGY